MHILLQGSGILSLVVFGLLMDEFTSKNFQSSDVNSPISKEK